MDSLRVPKGGGSKSSSSIPLAIRFNAGEESIEDIIKPSESLSSSPQQSSEDFSWRKEFLQGNFFHRKRSGSVEGAPGGTLISNLSSSDTNAVGTWKLIKGKVSQAMEDIKASKSSHAIPKTDGNDDSDLETINSSISDELSVDQPVTSGLSSKQPKSAHFSLGHKTDSDSDIDNDIFLTADDLESTTIRKSFANLRSKAISRHSKLSKKEETPSSIRTTFLRKRKKQHPETENPSQVTKPKKDYEIESGVEMLEDMILPSTAVHETARDKSSQDEILITFSKESISYRQARDDDKDAFLNFSIDPTNLGNSETQFGAPNLSRIGPRHSPAPSLPYTSCDIVQRTRCFFRTVQRNCSIIVTVTLLVFLLFLPLPDFFRGVISCLLTISLFTCLSDAVKTYIGRRNNGRGPEKTKFQIPDYGSMPIYEIPAAEEHKPMKTYSGWMNEINNYDPANYHISMTRSVFIRLDGSILRLSNTTARIPKRSMWNEQPVDRKNITFTRNRCFNLLGCRVEMCPRGLARKRHFSRKYPVQLIIKNAEPGKQDEDCGGKRHSQPSDQGEMLQHVPGPMAGTTSESQNPTIQHTGESSSGVVHQSSNDSVDEKSERTQLSYPQSDLDFGTTILNSDLQKLQETHETFSKDSVPCGDETRILLFARCDREKEDWYRRFYAASVGATSDQELRVPDIVMVTEEEIASAIKATCGLDGDGEDVLSVDEKKISVEMQQKRDSQTSESSLFEGLLMTPCSARNPPDYIRFMTRYQKACTQSSIPVKKSPFPSSSDRLSRRSRRQKRQEDELWKGIDQSLYLGPSGSVVWANVLLGRILYSCLNDTILLEKIQEFLQRKLSAIRLPSFMEDVVISEVYLGDTPPLIHRVSQPLLDERGTWIDADVTYEGLMHMTITTKLNLLRLKRQQNQSAAAAATTAASQPFGEDSNNIGSSNSTETMQLIGGDVSSSPCLNCAIYDSNAESSGASSSESESPTMGTTDPSSEPQTFYSTPGSSRRLLRIVDRITASNLFQSATEISYIQRAMENMSTKITLRVELKGLVSRVVVNLPPPPSDRVWIAFRGPPRLWISAKPAVGDHTFDWSIVTNVIESKLCDEVYKYLVYPNMVDIIVPFLGQPTYKE